MSGAIMNKIWGAFGMDANEEEEEDYVENNEEMEEEEENNKENNIRNPVRTQPIDKIRSQENRNQHSQASKYSYNRKSKEQSL